MTAVDLIISFPPISFLLSACILRKQEGTAPLNICPFVGWGGGPWASVPLAVLSETGDMGGNPAPQVANLQPTPLWALLQNPGSCWLQLCIPSEPVPPQRGVERKVHFPRARLSHLQRFQNGSRAPAFSFWRLWSLFSITRGFLFQPNSLSTHFHSISRATPAWNHGRT